MQSSVLEHWQINKPAVHGKFGLVASQHHLASDVGARILELGGNAIDAAIATGLTLGTVEPWMSGIGGGGYMTIYLAKERPSRSWNLACALHLPLFQRIIHWPRTALIPPILSIGQQS